MPQADSVTARLAAARAGAVAAELQRLRTRLAGAVARDGWSGRARLAFDEELSDRIRMFDPVIARYDDYAAALISYARSLEQDLPALRAARARLDAAPCRVGAATGTDGTDPETTRDFERRWHDWDSARRTCVSALELAGRIGADRHGLSSLWHSATHAAHEVVRHVNLAEISKALSELGDVLFVAALVLSPVPGVGEVLWAAVAVVAVAKLAVDSTRAARGDKTVSKGDLAWDAVAALPGGRVTKAAREAAGAQKTVTVAEKVTGLAADAEKVDIVPGGGLMAHEGERGFGGHTLYKHVGKSYEYLVSRFRSPGTFRSSSFTDRATAEHLVAGALSHSGQHIEDWMKSDVPKLIIHATSDSLAGVTISRFGARTAKTTINFRLILEKSPNMADGYYITTAHPTP